MLHRPYFNSAMHSLSRTHLRLLVTLRPIARDSSMPATRSPTRTPADGRPQGYVCARHYGLYYLMQKNTNCRTIASRNGVERVLDARQHVTARGVMQSGCPMPCCHRIDEGASLNWRCGNMRKLHVRDGAAHLYRANTPYVRRDLQQARCAVSSRQNPTSAVGSFGLPSG